tara:strand:+ start:351 stop:740 length:390 start_codon:yes stop_codon:yes gene_type:complete
MNNNVKTVLFVCVENACRSQLAEAMSNHFFPDQLKAFSAGSSPGKEVNPKAIRSLNNMGIVHKGKTKSISQVEEKKYDYIVMMGCGDACPIIPGEQMLEWGIPDPKLFELKKFNKVRDMIKEKIETELL